MRIHLLWIPLICLAAACSNQDQNGGPASGKPGLPSVTLEAGPHDVAVLTLKGMGEIRFELLPEAAPKTVANFVALANDGFYDNTQFHRVIPGFMIQGGDPNTKRMDARAYGGGGPEHTIEDEFTDVPHTRGMVSMANKGYPNSGGSQFFILHGDAEHLNGRHAIFGRVVAGMDVVDAITEMQLDKVGRFGPRDRPYPEFAVVETVRIEPAGS